MLLLLASPALAGGFFFFFFFYYCITCLSVKEMQEILIQSLGQEDPLEKEMTTHSSILAWRIPRTEEPGGLQSMRSQELDRT